MIIDSPLEIGDSIKLKSLKSSQVSVKYVQWLNDYEVVRFTEQRFLTHSHETVRAFVEEKNRSDSEILLGIFFVDSHIGNVKLGAINNVSNEAEISYLIGEKTYWGLGIATQVVGAITDYAVDKLSVTTIKAGYYSTNVGSKRVLEKCGYRLEEVKKKAIFFEGSEIDLCRVIFSYNNETEHAKSY